MLLSDLTLLAAVSIPLVAGQQHGQRQTGPITLPLVRHTPRNNLVKRDGAEASIFTNPVFTSYNHATPDCHSGLAELLFGSDTVLWVHGGAPSCERQPSGTDGVFYNASLSTSFSTDNQRIPPVAPQNDSEGIAANETVEFAGQSTTQAFVYNDRDTMTGQLYRVAGYLGFGLEGGATNSSLWQTLSAQWPKPVFGIYLGQHTATTSRYTSNDNDGFETTIELGQITLGGLNQSLYTGDVKYFDLVNKSFWSAPLDGLKVGDDTIEAKFNDGSKLNISPSINLAQQFSFMPDSVIDVLHAKIPGAEKHEFCLKACDPRGVNMTVYQVPCNTLSPITFTFGNMDITANASQWIRPLFDMQRADGFETNDTVCISMLTASDVGADEQTNRFYLGWQFLQNVYMVFNYGDNYQLGIAQLAPGLPVLNGDLVAQENGWEPTGPGKSGALAAASAAKATATAGAGGAETDDSNAAAHLDVRVVTTIAAVLLGILGGSSLF